MIKGEGVDAEESRDRQLSCECGRECAAGGSCGKRGGEVGCVVTETWLRGTGGHGEARVQPERI